MVTKGPIPTMFSTFAENAGSRPIWGVSAGEEAFGGPEFIAPMVCRSALDSASQPVEFPAISFRGPAILPRRFEARHGLSFFRYFQPQRPALFRFKIKRLRYDSRSAPVAEQQHLHLEIARIVSYLQSVADPYLA